MHNLHTVILQSMTSFLLFVIRNPQTVIRKGKIFKATGSLERLELELFSNLGLKLHKPFPCLPFEKSMMAALGL